MLVVDNSMDLDGVMDRYPSKTDLKRKEKGGDDFFLSMKSFKAVT